MKILEPITRHEMVRRFILGELDSPRFGSRDESDRRETKDLLESDDTRRQCEGILRQPHRLGFVASIPTDTDWSTGRLELTENDFQLLRPVKDDAWRRLSNGTFKLVDAATAVKDAPGRDPRIAEMIEASRKQPLNLTGITLFRQEGGKTYTIVEGSARLAALYVSQVACLQPQHPGESIEVVVGISSSAWKWTPPETSLRSPGNTDPP